MSLITICKLIAMPTIPTSSVFPYVRPREVVHLVAYADTGLDALVNLQVDARYHLDDAEPIQGVVASYEAS